jgi:hypothetical protein
LQQILESHPEILTAEETEVFGNEILPRLAGQRASAMPLDQLLDALSPDEMAAARRAYFEMMEAVLGQSISARMLIDKNPAMTLMIPAMKRVFPELKLLIMQRDPRDVVLSCFLRYLPINPVSVCFLTLQRTVERLMLDMGAWLKIRDLMDDWVEVRYESLVRNTEGEARAVLASLGLPWDEQVLGYRTRVPREPVRSPSYADVAQPISTAAIGRWRNYQKHLTPALDLLAPLLATLGYER